MNLLSRHLPAYQGLEWLSTPLPTGTEQWPRKSRAFYIGERLDYDISSEVLHGYTANKPWVWPGRDIFFICDVHADTDAFLRSLVASGGVAKFGPDDTDFSLTASGRDAVFVIGGDCLDKGPSNLRLLRALHHLISLGAQVELLAGNHDLRTRLGIEYAGRKEPHLAHLFVRMGRKSLRLFKEVFDGYIAPSGQTTFLSDDEVKARYFPDASWYEDFPEAVAHLVSEKKIAKELRRIREKCEDIKAKSAAYGMTLGMVVAAVEKCRELFLTPKGELSWFFTRMKLAYRAGSFLYVHAGVDNTTASILREHGVDGLNARFDALGKRDLFELYHGPIGNSFRTKYRELDWPLTESGVADLHCAGLYAIVHGHRNIPRGQRMIIRKGMLNFECDATMDINSRKAEGLDGLGGAVTVFRKDRLVQGISTDHPAVKVFDPKPLFNMTLLV